MRQPAPNRGGPRLSKPSSTTTSPTSPSTSTSTPPPPFTPAPAIVTPLLALLDPAKVYIIHIDPFPRAFKRRIFAVPLLLNLALAALLLWRTVAALPTYAALLRAVFIPAERAAAATATAALSWRAGALLVLRRAATMLFDYVLVRVVAQWPGTFFFERGGNPVLWRWAIGFRDREVVVRASRGWGAADVLGRGGKQSGEGGVRRREDKVGGESPFFKTRIAPAVERGFVARKTGYLMMGRDWDLDFGAMVAVTALVDAGTLEMGELRRTVLVCDERLGWMAWRAFEEDEGPEEEGRRRIVAFKDRLTAMGKEGLFFRWVELVQYESSQAGGFTASRQTRVVDKARAVFAEQGVDFDDFAAAIGGVQEMPGMEGQG